MREGKSNISSVGLLYLLLLVSVVVGSVLPRSGFAQIATPIGMTATDARLPDYAPGYHNLDSFITVNRHDGAANSGMFWSQQFDFPGGDGGYLGVQTNGRHIDGQTRSRLVLFSMFDNRSDVDRGILPAHRNCRYFGTDGDDGKFVKCSLEYNWTQGREYRLRIWSQGEQPNGMMRWGAWIRDMSAGENAFIGAIDVPQSWALLGSYANAFSEYFGPGINSCADIPTTSATWKRPTANNGTVRTNTTAPRAYGVCESIASASDVGNAIEVKSRGGGNFNGIFRLTSSWDTPTSYLARYGVSDGNGGSNPGRRGGVEKLVRQWDNMKWTIEPAGNGLYRIRNGWGPDSGYLSRRAKWDGSNWVPSNSVYFDTLRPGWLRQKWRLEFVDGNRYRIASSYGSNGYLRRNGVQNPDGSWRPGTGISLERKKLRPQQIWKFQR